METKPSSFTHHSFYSLMFPRQKRAVFSTAADGERLSRHPRRGLAEALVGWGRRRKGKPRPLAADRGFLCRPTKTATHPL